MSIKTWKKKYYPIPAQNTKGWDTKDTIDHCIQKWKELRKSKLRKHEVAMTRWKMSDADSAIPITTGDECSLCVKYAGNFCGECPIVKVIGRRCHDGPNSPWDVMNNDGDPKPMIKLLKKVRRETLKK